MVLFESNYSTNISTHFLVWNSFVPAGFFATFYFVALLFWHFEDYLFYLILPPLLIVNTVLIQLNYIEVQS